MFNLLPQNLKDMILSEYKRRRLVLALFFLVCVEATFLIFLFPTWLVSSYKEKEIIIQSEQMSQFLKGANINPATSIIKTINTKLLVLNTALEYPKFVPYIDTVISKKTSSIVLTEFSFSPTASSSAAFTLSGTSATRESLVSYVKRLQDSGAFKQVDLPIGNLAKDKNIDFTLNLTI